MAFSPDGSRIVSGSNDKTVRVWDTFSGTEAIMHPLLGHEGRVTSVAFSPDGSRIVTGSCDKTIRVWDAFDGIEVFPPIQGHQEEVNCVAFSPDGFKIVSGSGDNTVRVWDALTGTAVMAPFRGHVGTHITTVAFSSDGSKVISGSDDGTVRVWDATGNIVDGEDCDMPAPSPLEVPIHLDEHGFFIQLESGHHLTNVPADFWLYGGKVCQSSFVGWTVHHKIVIIGCTL